MVLHAVWDIIIRIPGNFCEGIYEGAVLNFIPASNEPSSCACTDIWRMPRGSNTPQLCCAASLIPRQLAAGYLIYASQGILELGIFLIVVIIICIWKEKDDNQ